MSRRAARSTTRPTDVRSRRWARGPASRSRPYVARGASTPRCGSTRARSSRSRRPRSQGVGVRVIVDGRAGLRLRRHARRRRASPRRWPRPATTPRFGTPDEYLGLAEPDGVAVPELDLWRDGAGRRSRPSTRSRWPWSSSGPSRAADPRITRRRGGRVRRRASARAPWPPPPASAPPAGRPPATSSAYALADEGDETQTGFGFSVGREPADLDVERGRRRRRRAGHPPARRDASRRAARHRRARPVRHRAVPRHHRRHAERRGGPQGPVAVRRPARRGGRRRRSSRWSTTPPTRAPIGATDTDGEGLATRRNVLIDGGVLQQFVHNTYTARRSGTALDRLRGARRLQVDAGRRLPGRCRWRRAPATQAELLADVGDGVLVHVGAGLHSGVNPVQRRLLDRRRGPAHHAAASWPNRCASSRSPRRCSGCCTTWSAVGNDVEWLPDERRRRQPGHPRRHRLRHLRLRAAPSASAYWVCWCAPRCAPANPGRGFGLHAAFGGRFGQEDESAVDVEGVAPFELDGVVESLRRSRSTTLLGRRRGTRGRRIG